MAYVLQLVSLVTGGETAQDGHFVVEYDPSVGAAVDECLLRTSPNIARAKRYPSRDDAFYEWRRIDIRRPLRSDGRPNSPLTAYNVHIQHVEE